MIKFKLVASIVAFICISNSIYAQTDSINSSSNQTINRSFNNFGAASISRIDSILNFSKNYLGKPYRGGSACPNSFDCSGFTSFVFSNFGVKLGRSSRDQAEQTPTVSNDDIQPGDLVFFNGHHRGSRIGHVGLDVEKKENGEFTFIHSASSSGISISNSDAPYYRKRFIKAGRVFNTDSLIARASSTSVTTPNIVENSTLAENQNTVRYETVAVTKKVPAKYHTVKSGETLSSIAQKHGTTIAQLKKKNKLTSDFLSLKQRLKIADSYETKVYEKQLVKTTVKMANDSTQLANDPLPQIQDDDNSETTQHKVGKGETLYSIAKAYQMTVDELKSINKLNNGKIFPGQQLNVTRNTIPEKADQSIAKTETEKKAKKNEKRITHVVKSGETLSEIAEKYKCTIAQIKTWNSKKSTKINTGEKLKINT